MVHPVGAPSRREANESESFSSPASMARRTPAAMNIFVTLYTGSGSVDPLWLMFPNGSSGPR